MPSKWKLLSTKEIFRAGFFRLRSDRCELPDGRVMPRYFVMEFPEWANIVACTAAGEMVLVEQFRQASGQVCLEIPGGSVDVGKVMPPRVISNRIAPNSSAGSTSKAASVKAATMKMSSTKSASVEPATAINSTTAKSTATKTAKKATSVAALTLAKQAALDAKIEDPSDAAIRELREETGYEGQEVIKIGTHAPNPAMQNNQMHTYLILDCELKAKPQPDEFEDLKVVVLPISEVYRRLFAGEISHSIVMASLALAMPELKKRFPKQF